MPSRIRLGVLATLVIILFVPIALFVFLNYNFFNRGNGLNSFLVLSQLQQSEGLENEFPFHKGEAINYEVRLRNFRIGRAKIAYQGIAQIKSVRTFLVIFLTDVANFYDLESIYTDINKFNPVLVERQLQFFRNKERIEEDYTGEPNSVRITKYKTRPGKARVIISDAPFQHVISSLYYFRTLKGLWLGREFVLNLPLAKVKLIVKRIEEITVPAGKFRAIYIESIPKKYKIWLSADEKKLPLRVEGVVAFASAALVMTK